MVDRIYTVRELKEFLNKLPDDMEIFTFRPNFYDEWLENAEGIKCEIYTDGSDDNLKSLYLGD